MLSLLVIIHLILITVEDKRSTRECLQECRREVTRDPRMIRWVQVISKLVAQTSLDQLPNHSWLRSSAVSRADAIVRVVASAFAQLVSDRK